MREPRVLEDEAPQHSARVGAAAGVLRAVYPQLVASARFVTGGAGEDLAQDALIETLSRHPGFDGLENPLGYARTVLFRMAFRRAERMREVPADVSSLLEPVRDPAIQVVEREGLVEALETLGHRQRACVVLRYLEGLDDEEIGTVLGCRTSTVRSQIARGLRRMKLSFDDEEMT
jgi:RNA polymerase sigma factor (sigma-70 family)